MYSVPGIEQPCDKYLNEWKDKSQFSLFQVISTLPTFHTNVFYYLMAFLQELLKNSEKNHLDQNILGKHPSTCGKHLCPVRDSLGEMWLR